MKKAFPYLVAVGVGLVALYAVYHFRTTRLMPQHIEEMREAQARLAEVEAAAQSSTRDRVFDAIPASELPEVAPDVFQVAFECTTGDFVVECRKDWAPIGTQRFYELVKLGYYDNIRVFRAVPGFVVQFGITDSVQLNDTWMNSTIQDDPVTHSNTRGTITFAAGGSPNTRSAQVFINLSSDEANTRLDSMGFAPFGEVVYGMDTVDAFYDGYEDRPTREQRKISEYGNAYLDKNYPNLDTINRAYIIKPIDVSAGSGESQQVGAEGSAGESQGEPAVSH